MNRHLVRSCSPLAACAASIAAIVLTAGTMHQAAPADASESRLIRARQEKTPRQYCSVFSKRNECDVRSPRCEVLVAWVKNSHTSKRIKVKLRIQELTTPQPPATFKDVVVPSNGEIYGHPEEVTTSRGTAKWNVVIESAEYAN